MGAMSLGGTMIDSSADVRLAMGIVASTALHTAERLVGAHVAQSVPSLSHREHEVLRWVASGRRQADIALQLGLSERTIENHLRRIRKRLGVSSTAQAVHAVARSRIVDI